MFSVVNDENDARFERMASDDEKQDVQLGLRITKTMQTRIEKEQTRVKDLTGVDASISDIARMLIEKGLEANGKKR